MNPLRLNMRALCAFDLDAEDIDEGDLLALTEAEAAALMARGLVAPEGRAPRVLTDPELAEMHERLLDWATAPVFTDAFRQACGDTADLIASHLDGADNAALTAQAVEKVYGTLAFIETDRLARVEVLEAQMVEAYEREDAASWMVVFKQTLDLLSEGHAENLMRYIARMGQDDDAPDTVIDPALLHAMPQAMQ